MSNPVDILDTCTKGMFSAIDTKEDVLFKSLYKMWQNNKKEADKVSQCNNKLCTEIEEYYLLITEKETEEFYIGIDCAPGTPRPDQYIQKLCDIVHAKEVTSPYSKSFGAWSWKVLIPKGMFAIKKKEFKKQADELYTKGRIRGAVWGLVNEE